jgi:hypothetical protein
MHYLVEDPTLVIVSVLLIELFLGVALYHTGQGKVLLAIVLVAVLGIGLVLVEWLVWTDREQVTDVLYDAADAAVENDVERLFRHTVPENAAQGSQLRSAAERVLESYEFDARGIGNDLEITVNDRSNPPAARARFTCRVKGSVARDKFQFNFHLKLTVLLRKYEGRWLMYEYSHNVPGVP